MSGAVTSAPPVSAVDKPVVRMAGGDRFETAIAASREASPTGGAMGAVIARADGFADALAGSVLAARTGPMLLTGPNTLDPRVRAEIQRAVTPGATIYVLGTADVVGDAITTALEQDGHPVVRLGGADRSETAALIARQLQPDTTGSQYTASGSFCGFTFVTGRDFPDGLSAGTLNNPLLFTDGSAMPAASQAEVTRCLGTASPREHLFIAGVGGPATTALSAANVSWQVPAGRVRVAAGSDRYEASALILDLISGNGEEAPRSVLVATGADFPDALVGTGTLAHTLYNFGGTPTPVALTRPDRLPADVLDVIAGPYLPISNAYVMGGPDDVLAEVRTAIS